MPSSAGKQTVQGGVLVNQILSESAGADNGSMLAVYQPDPLENWYRHHYFNNEFDISGSGVEEFTFHEIQKIAGFSFRELDGRQVSGGHTVGNLHIRTHLSNLFGTGDPEMVMVTNGANEGLQLVIISLLRAGDELITLGPCYRCHDKIAVSTGCEVKKWLLPMDGDNKTDLNDLENLISTKTKVLCLNFLHNPTEQSISQTMLD